MRSIRGLTPVEEDNFGSNDELMRPVDEISVALKCRRTGHHSVITILVVP
jgi:hypothetical protein